MALRWFHARTALAAALVAAPLLGQAPMPNPEASRPDEATRRQAAIDGLAFRPDANGVAALQAQLGGGPEVGASAKAAAAELRGRAAAANAAGRPNEALRLLYQAISVQRGGDWPADEFGASLLLDPVTPVADRAGPLYVLLRGAWPAKAPADPLSIRFSALEDKPNGARIADLGERRASSADFVAAPARFALPLTRVPAGRYRLSAEVSVGGRTVARLLAPLDVVDGLAATEADVDRRLGRIQGHAAADATIRYPFSLARDLNLRERETLAYDFTANIARSRALLGELEAGRDPIERATGDVRRARFDTDAGTIIPYRIYVPRSWNGAARLPMIVFLHGANLDENDGLTRGDGTLEKLAEARGYIVVAPLGYRMNSGYGANLPPAGPQGFGLLADPDARRAALSEADVLATSDLIAKEYGVDPRRVYLMGNSMGGMGVWHLAGKYPARWAAISPSAGGVNAPGFPYAALKDMPIRAVTGDLDQARPAVLKTVAAARENGLDPSLVVVPGGTHGSSVNTAMSGTLDFFGDHRRPGGR